ATINVGGGGLSSVNANISTTAENLIPTIRLTVEMLRVPAFLESDFKQIRKQRIAQINRGRTEPGTLAPQTLQSNLNPYPRSDVPHVRKIDEQIEDLNKVTLDDVKNFHQKFYTASHSELIVVGKFDSTTVERETSELLETWKDATPYQRIVISYKEVQR